jgi:hypothetical protein
MRASNVKRGVLALLVLALVAAIPAASMASVVLVQDHAAYTITAGNPRAGNGGPFVMTNATYGYFDTYCVEQGEYISLGGTYYVGDPTSDPAGTGLSYETVRTDRELSGYTAWLYTMARDHDLWQLPSEMGTGTAGAIIGTDTQYLQQAIWAGMLGTEQGSTFTNWGVGRLNDVVPKIGAPTGGAHDGAEFEISNWAEYANRGISFADFLASGWNGEVTGLSPGEALPVDTTARNLIISAMMSHTGDVVVLNMYTSDGFLAQDQLGLTNGDGNPPIPEPATIIVWSLLGAASWLGMGVWRRRRGPVGRQPWSDENRSAICAIIERSRN